MIDKITVKQNVESAWKLMGADQYLFSNKVYEVTICSKFPHYLQKLFQSEKLIVDIEYNKHLDKQKQTRDGKPFRPDILVHERGGDGQNILAIEMVKQYREKAMVDTMRKRLREEMKEYFEYHNALLIVIPKEFKIAETPFDTISEWI